MAVDQYAVIKQHKSGKQKSNVEIEKQLDMNR